MVFQPSPYSESNRSLGVVDVKSIEAIADITGQAATTGIQIGQAVGQSRRAKKKLARAKSAKKRKTEDSPSLPSPVQVESGSFTPLTAVVVALVIGGTGVFWYVRRGKAGSEKKK
jgi:hypothetical protein